MSATELVIVIAGTRSVSNASDAVSGAFFRSPWGNRHRVKIISGGGGNIDMAAEQFALSMKFPFQEFPADWNQHGKAAGPIRNRQMAEMADVGIVVWDGQSRGTLNMVTELVKRRRPIFVWPDSL